MLKKKELMKKAEKLSKSSESSRKTIFCQVKCKLIEKHMDYISLKIHTALKFTEGEEAAKIRLGFGRLQRVWE